MARRQIRTAFHIGKANSKDKADQIVVALTGAFKSHQFEAWPYGGTGYANPEAYTIEMVAGPIMTQKETEALAYFFAGACSVLTRRKSENVV